VNTVEIDRELATYREGDWDDIDAHTELALIATLGGRAWVEAPSDDDALAMLSKINQPWVWWTMGRVRVRP
jgi:hypothetical protein